MSREEWTLGWDIGGAHLKVALADASGRLLRFDAYYSPLWRGLEHLDQALEKVGAGVGRFLVRRLARRLDRSYLDISTLMGAEATSSGVDAADCAPAAAVALLALGSTHAKID